jgi:hypothetical protein
MPYDQRYLWQVVPRTNVDAATTAVQVIQQSARTLASAANVNRALTAVTAKPETSSTIQIVTMSMRQLANVQSGVPNYLLEQPAVNTVIEADLRLALNDALDALVLAGVAGSGFQSPGSDNILVSIRKSISTLQAAGYNPDTLVMTPAAAEAIDVMVSGITGGTADFVFAPGQFAPDSIFGLRRVISKGIPASAVMDSKNFGRLYTGPVSLSRHEENAGSTNTSLIRMEMHAVWGTERQAAAVRIAAS